MLEAHLCVILGCRTSQPQNSQNYVDVEGRQENASSHLINDTIFSSGD